MRESCHEKQKWCFYHSKASSKGQGYWSDWFITKAGDAVRVCCCICDECLICNMSRGGAGLGYYDVTKGAGLLAYSSLIGRPNLMT